MAIINACTQADFQAAEARREWMHGWIRDHACMTAREARAYRKRYHDSMHAHMDVLDRLRAEGGCERDIMHAVDTVNVYRSLMDACIDRLRELGVVA